MELITGDDLRHITTPAIEFDRLFAPKDYGYLGADAALSIPLGDGRILWIFGDTLIGQQKSGKRILEAMPRNTIAIQYPGAPVPENIEWIVTNRDGVPSDFFSLPPTEADRWFWPGTGICVDKELFVFGYGVSYAPGECEALSFKVDDCWLIRIRDTSRHPYDWKKEVLPLKMPDRSIWFASACLLESPFLYLLGIKLAPERLSSTITSAVLARVPIEDLCKRGHLCSIEYLNYGEESIKWEPTANNLAQLFQPGVTECSIWYDAQRKRYLATTYYFSQFPDFFITTAPELTGPWSFPRLVFREQSATPISAHLFYALRMHPHLAANADEMILTYIVNTRCQKDLLENCDKYYPRFLRVDLTKLVS